MRPYAWARLLVCFGQLSSNDSLLGLVESNAKFGAPLENRSGVVLPLMKRGKRSQVKNSIQLPPEYRAHEGREREPSSDLALGERKFNDTQGGEAQVTSRD
ncbi:hypothetical protein NQZ68_002624 [Dissostichus eleginoides]|nr:hypothetical protein NQZ68_002624 [Dissostichus eleginoides]